MKKYKITKKLGREPKITKVKVKKETKHLIFFKGKGQSKAMKKSDYDSYCDTYSDARNALFAFADSKVEDAEYSLEVAEKYRSNCYKNIGYDNEK